MDKTPGYIAVSVFYEEMVANKIITAEGWERVAAAVIAHVRPQIEAELAAAKELLPNMLHQQRIPSQTDWWSVAIGKNRELSEVRKQFAKEKALSWDLKKALELTMIGGNHLPELIGNHPPKNTSPEIVMQHYAEHPKMYAAWCCWNAIMQARDIMEGSENG